MQPKWLDKRDVAAGAVERGIYAASMWPTIWWAMAIGIADVEAE